MTKINFTQEDKNRHELLALILLFSGAVISGLMGTAINVFQILHNTTISSLQTLLGNLKKEIAKIKDLDRWSLTTFQVGKLSKLEQQYEFVDLTIGWKKYLDQQNAEKEAIRELKAKYAELKTSTMSPTDQLAALAKEIRSMGGEVEEEAPSTPVADPGAPLSDGITSEQPA